ncbi:MAG TPA: FAD-binding oxidoreductase, partial [Thermomicrobiales bacterium]|nr:FAD-binding oxidoreductase [Thermomicrobiales bacterium]
TTMAEIAAVLAEKGQEIPIDVPFPERTTIGGLAATGFAGPRRLLSGSLKDAIIGCEYVRGDGLVAKAGGLVVKNVSGFEIPRFLHGSWGALAVLTSINLKVSPRPRSEATVQAEWRDVAAAVASMHELARRIPSLAAIGIEVGDGSVISSCRVMGREEAVNATVEQIAAVLAADRAVIPTSESREFWQEYVNAWAPPRSGTQVVIGVRPSEVGGTVNAIRAALAGADRRATLSIAPGLGSIRVRLAAGDDDVPIWPLSRLGELPELTTGVLESGPDSVRKAADPWGPRPQGLALMAEIKRQFDPGNILNRGRLFI